MEFFILISSAGFLYGQTEIELGSVDTAGNITQIKKLITDGKLPSLSTLESIDSSKLKESAIKLIGKSINGLQVDNTVKLAFYIAERTTAYTNRISQDSKKIRAEALKQEHLRTYLSLYISYRTNHQAPGETKSHQLLCRALICQHYNQYVSPQFPDAGGCSGGGGWLSLIKDFIGFLLILSPLKLFFQTSP